MNNSGRVSMFKSLFSALFIVLLTAAFFQSCGAGPSTSSNGAFLLSILDGTDAYDSAQDVATNPDNNIYVAGITKGDLGAGTNAGLGDAFLRKYDEGGAVMWETLLGTASEDQANGVTLDGGGYVYTTGETKGALSGEANSGESDAFITKHHSNGTLLWTKLLGTTFTDTASDIALYSSENIIIVGSTEGDLGDGNTNSGSSDAFIAKYDSNGTNTWTQLLGGAEYDYAYAVATDSSGNIYVTGKTDSALLNGKENSGSFDAFIAKYNSDGALQWLELLGTEGYEEGLDITVDLNGYVYICGYTNGDLSEETNSGGMDAFMAKYTSSGERTWTVLLGSSSAERATGIQVDSSGKIYLTGYTEGNLGDETNSGATDAFIAQYDSSATLTSVTLIGTAGYEYSNAIILNINRNIHIAGRSNGNLNGATNAGDYDFFVVKM